MCLIGLIYFYAAGGVVKKYAGVRVLWQTVRAIFQKSALGA